MQPWWRKCGICMSHIVALDKEHSYFLFPDVRQIITYYFHWLQCCLSIPMWIDSRYLSQMQPSCLLPTASDTFDYHLGYKAVVFILNVVFFCWEMYICYFFADARTSIAHSTTTVQVLVLRTTSAIWHFKFLMSRDVGTYEYQCIQKVLFILTNMSYYQFISINIPCWY